MSANETDYTEYAMYQEAMRAYGAPEFAVWLCETYPWGGVDMGAAHRSWEQAQPADSCEGEGNWPVQGEDEHDDDYNYRLDDAMFGDEDSDLGGLV